MADEGFKRKLAAILSADVEGCRRPMGENVGIIFLKFTLGFIAIFLLGATDHALCENGQKDSRLLNPNLAITEIEFRNVNLLSSGFGGYEFTGRIRNRSKKFTLYSVEIHILFYDCINRSNDRACSIIGERKESIYFTIPPEQERDFKEPIFIYGDLLNTKGDLVWRYELLSAKSGEGN